MLAAQQSSRPLTILILTNILAFICIATTTALTIAYQYRGLGITTNPISCTSTSTYFSIKYNQDNYLSAISLSEVVAAVCALVLLIMVIALRTRLGGWKRSPQQLYEPWSIKIHGAICLMLSISTVCMVIPTAYFLSFMRQVSSECGFSILTQWILIFIFAIISIIFNLISLVVLLWVSLKNQQYEQKQKLVDDVSHCVNSQISPNKQISNVRQQISEDNRPIESKNIEESIVKVNEVVQNELQHTNSKKELKQPLIVVAEPYQPPYNRYHTRQHQYERQRQQLQHLRAQRRLQQQRLLQLERKKQRLTSSQFKTQSQPIPVTTHTSVGKQNDKANQTIINIHMGRQQPSASVTSTTSEPHNSSIPVHNIRKTRQSKSYERYYPIYEEDSQESQLKLHHRRKYNRYEEEDRMGYYQPKLRSKGSNPYFREQDEREQFYQQKYQQANMLNSQNRRLSLGHTASIHVAPHTVQQVPSLIVQPPPQPTNDYQISQVKILTRPFEGKASKVGNGGGETEKRGSRVEHQFQKQESRVKQLYLPQQKRQEQSFVKQLMDQSQINHKRIPDFNAPKKSKKPNTKQSQLQAYIKALNTNMNNNRPSFDNPLNSDSEVSYNSILSQFQKGQQPQNTRLGSQSWHRAQKRIQQKYKRK